MRLDSSVPATSSLPASSLDKSKVSRLLEEMSQTRVLMIGDVILDEYRWGSALGLSAETPTIVARDDTTSVSIGGAGLYCRNMLALGGKVKFISLVGEMSSSDLPIVFVTRTFRNPLSRTRQERRR